MAQRRGHRWRPEPGAPKRPLAQHEPLRFGIDIDGTISQAPRHFKRLIDALMAAGNEVYIVTARRESIRASTMDFLSSLGIRCTEVIMLPDDWPRAVPEFKAMVARERRLHLTFDDDKANCWAVEQRTEALAAHMLPIPEAPLQGEATQPTLAAEEMPAVDGSGDEPTPPGAAGR